jgi:hypothetical protein
MLQLLVIARYRPARPECSAAPDILAQNTVSIATNKLEMTRA